MQPQFSIRLLTEMPQTERSAYLAGLVDGEGSIGLYYLNRKKKSKYHEHTPTPSGRIVIATTSKSLVDWWNREFGAIGRVFLNSRPKPNKPVWTIHLIKKRHVAEILNAVLPFLIVKRRQAMLMLEFLGLDNTGLRSLSTERMRTIADEIKVLNQRGRNKPH